MVFLTQINIYMEIVHSKIIQTHSQNVPHFDVAGFVYLSSEVSFSYNSIDMSGYDTRAVFVSASVPERSPSAQFRQSLHETGLYQIGIYVNEYSLGMSRRCIPSKLNFAG